MITCPRVSSLLSTIRMIIIKFRSILFESGFLTLPIPLFTVFWTVALCSFHFHFLLSFSTPFGDNILFHFHSLFVLFISLPKRRKKKYSLLFIINSNVEWASAQITKSRFLFKIEEKKEHKKGRKSNCTPNEWQFCLLSLWVND